MKDYLTIGSSPHDENCAQLGASDYTVRGRIELECFKEQIRRAYGDPPPGASIIVKSFPHDFGTYKEVCIVFEDENEDAVNYAYSVEADEKNKLAYWDDKPFIQKNSYLPAIADQLQIKLMKVRLQ